NSRGAIIDCNRNIDEPGRIASAIGSTRFISGKPLDILGLEPMERAQFTHEVVPAYPKGADGNRTAGHLTIDSIVDGSGRVIDAFVTSSSGIDYLDAAAMKAALASTYEPAPAGAVRAYQLTYRFVP
ncbi:MAG TPA: TonB family protein, partial [Candidatus Eremiobacteraceae bacterium]|nr:TonB family protein [Candidatus Eremiobacteraceae bacterium]